MSARGSSQQADAKSDPITRVSADILRLPTIRAHTLSMATMTEQRTVLVRVETEQGYVGLGEAATIGGLAYSDESPDSIKLTIDKYFAPILLNQSAQHFGKLRARLDQTAVGNYFAKMAVETALLDIAGKRSDLSVSEFLGGRITDRLEVAWTLASGDTARDIEEGESVLIARRHRHFKLKIGKRLWREDVAHCEAIADAFKGRASVRVDVNQAWDLATAKQAIPALYDAGIVMVEQPLLASDYNGMRLLTEQTSMSIVADEAMRGGAPTALKIIQARACDGISLKIAQAGGLSACRAVADLGLAAGLGLYGGTMLEGPIATAASAHLFSCLPSIRWYTELFGPLLLADEMLSTPLLYGDFGLTVPDGAGLGISLNDDAVDDAIAREVSAKQ